MLHSRCLLSPLGWRQTWIVLAGPYSRITAQSFAAMWVSRSFEWILFGLFLSLLSVCRPWCPRRKGSPRQQLTWRPQSMSLRRQRSAPMLNVEATGLMLIDPIGAGSARPPTSTVTPPYYPPKTSKNLFLCGNARKSICSLVNRSMTNIQDCGTMARRIAANGTLVSLG